MCSVEGCLIVWFALNYHWPSLLLTTASYWCCLPAKEEKSGNKVPLTYADILAFGGEQGQKVGEDNWRIKGAKAWSSIPQHISPGEDPPPAEPNSS